MARPFTITCDAFLDGRLQVRQPGTGFRSGLDAVFLAAACPAHAGDHVLEAGCGAGVASLCLLARLPGVSVTGVEIDPDLAALANENADANGVARAFQTLVADVTAGWGTPEAAGLRPETYDHVMANPPFYVHGRSRPAKDRRNARARSMPEGELDGWLRFLAAAAKPGGTCTVIHTAEALSELLNAMEGRFGGLRLFPLHAREDTPAIRVIISGTKGSRAPLSIGRGMVLHHKDGTQTAAATSILRQGSGLI